MDPTNQPAPNNGFMVQQPTVTAKHHLWRYVAGAVVLVIALALIYFFPFASFAAKNYAGRLSTQPLNVEDALDTQIKASIADKKLTQAEKNAVSESKTKYLEEKSRRPKLLNLPLADIVNSRYEKAIECKNEVKAYDIKTRRTVDETLQALTYNDLYQTASTTTVSSIDSGVAASGDKVKVTVDSLAEAVEKESRKLQNANAPSSLFNVHFEIIESMQKVNTSLKVLATAKESSDVEVQSQLTSTMNTDAAIIVNLGTEIQEHIQSLQAKTKESREHSTRVEQLEREILNQ